MSEKGRNPAHRFRVFPAGVAKYTIYRTPDQDKATAVAQRRADEQGVPWTVVDFGPKPATWPEETTVLPRANKELDNR